MAMRITWRQCHINVQTVWAFPPSFAVRADVLEGRPVNEIGAKYVTEWMPPYSCLKYVYVPIKEDTDNWYLMVISMEQEVVYHLDPYVLSERIKSRRENISKLCEKVVHFMTSDWLALDFLNPPNNMVTWEIKTIIPAKIMLLAFNIMGVRMDGNGFFLLTKCALDIEREQSANEDCYDDSSRRP
ncbi:Ulp1 protease family, C-terminal catalytic domain [Sesbania bispinosa]|nr:Ulp1 protease family, C-terminal catalytic domain [Sesbania bispinosa]